MELITTPAADNSNSFVSVEAVTNFLSGVALQAWDALGTIELRVSLIREVVEDIDALNYNAARYSATQSLRFPFDTHYQTVNGQKVPFIHPRVKKACFYEIEARLLAPGTVEALLYRERGITSVSLPGGVRTTFTSKRPSSQDKLSVKTRDMLACFRPTRNIRVERG